MKNFNFMVRLANIATLLSCLSIPAYASIDYSNYSEGNGFLLANVSTLEKGDKKIVLIPMVHISTGGFYRGVNQEFEKYSGQNAVILQEGVSVCDPESDVSRLAWFPTDSFDAAKASTILAESRNGKEPSDADLEAAGFEKRDCAKEPKLGRFGRFKKKYLSTYTLLGAIFQLRSQGTISELYPKDVEHKDGDIIGSHLKSNLDQMIFDSMVDCFEAFVRGSSGNDRCGRTVSWLKSSVDTESYIVKLRNEVLMAKLMRSLGLESSNAVNSRYEITSDEIGGNHDVAILAWGAAHFEDGNAAFPTALVDDGFSLSRTDEIRISRCWRVRLNPILNMTASGVCR